ncbi:hypothetical protein F0U44_09600 [Nocardioides humilatus]|uniref:ARB-07466-like C-terminal domain-containing protein n=1 Tax=Nocardioides humilatus TaxID=2607660 RepID=A0A5B1LGF6_9ACTN|nr:hypothetical protein [Nocardioides humilatus]KAA1418737.1 hypothetical protein F0U44_09600 [Nocardioides humilatus]
MRGRGFAIVIGFAALAVVVTVGIAVFHAVDDIVSGPSGDCSATVANHEVEISGEQAENATLITAIGLRRGLPARAVSIALATAFQESKLTNIDYGDRDSLGLFQQRPSQGWGTRAQILDRDYSTNAFYDALVQVDGYEDMEITEAAQHVQRSAYPSAYADHEEDARALASALTGYSPASFSCDLDGGAPSEDSKRLESGLTARADAVREDLLEQFGSLDLADLDGSSIDVSMRPVSEASKVRGWALAHYLVGNADRLDIRTVAFDGQVWTAGRDGWRRDEKQASDRVHVDVFD